MQKSEKNKIYYVLLIIITFLIIVLSNNSSLGYTAQPTTDGGRAICDKAEDLLKQMHSMGGWRYALGHGNRKKNWNIAKKYRESTCGTFVKWVFQEAGYLKPNTVISHKSTAEKTKDAFEKNTVNCTWITPNKKLRDIKDELLPGDCIVFPETIVIYAGYEKGTYYTYNCINNHRFKECIKAEGARETNFLHKYKVICIVRPGEGGNSGSDEYSTTENYGTKDNESDTFVGAVFQFFRNCLDSLLTFIENSFSEKDTSTVMMDFNTEDDAVSYGGIGGVSDGSMVNEPDANSIKRFAKTRGSIQNFAITDLDGSPIVWLGCNPKEDPKNFTVKIYKNANSNSTGTQSAKIVLNAGGHQCFSVWKNGANYDIYTGSYGFMKTGHKHSRDYYNPKGVAKTVINSISESKTKSLKNEGILLSNLKRYSKHVSSLGVDESRGRMITVVGGKATIWDLNLSNFNSSSRIGNKFKVDTDSFQQGGCLCGDYYYLIGGMEATEIKIGCYDINTGKLVWSKKLNTARITGNHEPEGIKVYNYNGSNKIFIAFNLGGGIWYFDS